MSHLIGTVGYHITHCRIVTYSGIGMNVTLELGTTWGSGSYKNQEQRTVVSIMSGVLSPYFFPSTELPATLLSYPRKRCRFLRVLSKAVCTAIAPVPVLRKLSLSVDLSRDLHRCLTRIWGCWLRLSTESIPFAAMSASLHHQMKALASLHSRAIRSPLP